MKKQILLVNNSFFPLVNEKAIAHGDFCKFAEELYGYFPEFTIWGMHSLDPAKNAFCPAGGFPVTDYCKNYKSYPLPKGYAKIWQPFVILRIFLSVFWNVRKYDYLYIFFPGRLPEIVCLFAWFWRKHYGIYVRGEHINNPIQHFILKHADFALCEGAILRDKTAAFCKDSEENVPLSEVFFKPGIPVRDHKKEEPLNGLLVGRIEREKGIYELVDSLTVLHQEQYKFHFTVVGGAAPEILQYVKESPVAEFITMTGAITDRKKLDEMYQNSDFFCLPSYSEGFPRVLYEAIAFGLPVLTTLVGSIGGLFHHEENCLAFEPRDRKGLTDVLRRIFTDKALRLRLAETSATLFQTRKKQFGGRTHAKQVYEKVQKYV